MTTGEITSKCAGGCRPSVLSCFICDLLSFVKGKKSERFYQTNWSSNLHSQTLLFFDDRITDNDLHVSVNY